MSLGLYDFIFSKTNEGNFMQKSSKYTFQNDWTFGRWFGRFFEKLSDTRNVQKCIHHTRCHFRNSRQTDTWSAQGNFAWVNNQCVGFLFKILPYELKFRDPSAKSISAVSKAAKESGDFASLSAVDLQVNWFYGLGPFNKFVMWILVQNIAEKSSICFN